MKPIIYFDLETSGLKDHHEITQIAAVAARNDEVLSEFEVKLKFNVQKADPEALEMTGYSDERWLTAVEPMEACEAFVKWLRPFCHVEKLSLKNRIYRVARGGGYNAAKFDFPKLQELFNQLDLFLPIDYAILDVMHLTRWYYELNPFDRPADLKLTTVCAAFGIPIETAHDALEDTKGTAKLAYLLTRRD